MPENVKDVHLLLVKKIQYSILILFFTHPFFLFSQSSTQIPDKEKAVVFAQIFSGFYYALDGNVVPRAAFQFNQGILGYKNQFSDKLGAKIMFDVTRTTHIYNLYDNNGNPVDIDYFEGSKYTAYLKLAEISWKVADFLDLKFGQLLNTQYLTFQDKFWGYRYIDVTFNERYRLGMPADFGIQADLKIADKLLIQTSVVNGEGPFRYQDKFGKFLYANNIQYIPLENLTLKVYGDLSPAMADTGGYATKSVLAFFAGYKITKFRLGAEYTHVNNYTYLKNNKASGASVFGSIRVIDNWEFLLRYDQLVIDTQVDKENISYWIGGIHYQPDPQLSVSLNLRGESWENAPYIYFNVGAKF